MHEADHTQLQNSIVEELLKQVPQSNKEQLQAKTEELFRNLSDQQKLLSLSEDEVDLLVAFRKWSQSKDSASGVFHWRKRYGK